MAQNRRRRLWMTPMSELFLVSTSWLVKFVNGVNVNLTPTPSPPSVHTIYFTYGYI